MYVWAAKKPNLKIDDVNQVPSRELEEMENLNGSLCSAV